MVKPRNLTDWYQTVTDRLSEGSKKPVEIEKDLEQKARQRNEDHYDISEDVKSKQIEKETVKLRYIQDILYGLQDRGIVAQQKPFVKVDYNNFDSDYGDAYSLFAFANEVGAMIVYAMLDAMNLDSMKYLAKGFDKD